MGIQVNLRVEKSTGQLLGIGNGVTLAQFVSKEFSVVLPLPSATSAPRGPLVRVHLILEGVLFFSRARIAKGLCAGLGRTFYRWRPGGDPAAAVRRITRKAATVRSYISASCVAGARNRLDLQLQELLATIVPT